MISLYIPTKNSNKYLSKNLNAIESMSDNKLIKEILIIDTSSKREYEKLRQIVRKIKDKRIKIIKQKNPGLATARNLAIKNSKEELIANLDSDCIPDKNWLSKLINEIQEEDVAGIGGRVIELEKIKKPSLADKWRLVHLKQDWGNKRLINPLYLAGANGLFKREALIKVGLYNEKYKSNYEDVDLSLRLKGAGFKIIYEPKAIVYHIKRDTIKSVLKTSWAWSFYGNEPTTQFSQIKRGFFNIFKTVTYFISDLIHLRFTLLFIDILILPTHIKYDNLMKTKQK